MQSRVSLAVEKKKTCNCAQAVLCSYCDITGIPEGKAMALSGPFGLGMGCMEGTCGALTGAGIVIGAAFADKAVAMQKMKRIMEKFQARNGATQCRQIKGIDTHRVLRSCPDCVADACEFLEQELEDR